MFTGIVEEVGTVLERTDSRLVLSARRVLDGVQLGDSIAVNGCCLTVVQFDVDAGTWAADVSEETWSRTSLGDLQASSIVNLERPVRLMDRLGGHMVQGHVDATGLVVSPAPDLRISFDPEYRRYVVEKGSITIGPDWLSAAIIPHTIEATNLSQRHSGERVNVEFDVIAKYVENLMTHDTADHSANSGMDHDN